MKKITKKLLCALAACSIMGGCGAASEPVPTTTASANGETSADVKSEDNSEAKITLTLSHQLNENHSINITAKRFAELVNEKSDGTIAIDIFPSAALGTETENLQALTNGTLDIAVIACEFYANYVDEAGILCLPYIYQDYADCYNKLNGSAGDEIGALILDNTGVRILDYYVLSFRQIFTVNKEIKTIDDMAGLIIRIPDSTTYKTTFTQLGAAPTPLAWGETYTALDTGVVAAVENTPETVMSASMQEVCRNVNITNHLLAPTTFSMSDKVFEKLTPEQQQILLEAAAEACEFGKDMTIQNSDAQLAALEEAELTIVNTDMESMKAAVNYDDYACTQTDKGKEIMELLK